MTDEQLRAYHLAYLERLEIVKRAIKSFGAPKQAYSGDYGR